MKIKRDSYLLRGIVLVIGIIAFSGALIFANHDRFSRETDPNTFIEFETGRIVEIIEDNTFMDEIDPELRLGRMLFRIEMLNGHYEGEEIEVQHFFSSLASIYFDVGDRVSVRTNTLDGRLVNAEIHNVERTEVIIGLVIVFLVVLSLIGGKRGVMSVLGLVFTMISIVFLLIPLMLRGYPVILTTIGILSLVTVVILILLGGITPKTVSAILGCIIGVICAAIIASIAGNLTFISGFNMEDIGTLLFAVERNGLALHPSGLFISGVLIASLGAVMDTSISITSAMEEIQLAHPEIDSKQLFKSGMNIGRDAMGTMSNTLILAFAGTALNLMMFVYADGTPFNQLINNDFIVVELVRSIAGSLGIVLTVPTVAFIGSKMFILWKSEKKS